MNSRLEVRNRLLQLLEARSMSIYSLGMRSGVSPSTIKSILYGKSRNPGIVTIKLLCDGLGISLQEFFDTEAFGSTELEDLE